jgi:hypothetical protein
MDAAAADVASAVETAAEADAREAARSKPQNSSLPHASTISLPTNQMVTTISSSFQPSLLPNLQEKVTPITNLLTNQVQMENINTFTTNSHSNLLTTSPMVMPPMETTAEAKARGTATASDIWFLTVIAAANAASASRAFVEAVAREAARSKPQTTSLPHASTISLPTNQMVNTISSTSPMVMASMGTPITAGIQSVSCCEESAPEPPEPPWLMADMPPSISPDMPTLSSTYRPNTTSPLVMTSVGTTSTVLYQSPYYDSCMAFPLEMPSWTLRTSSVAMGLPQPSSVGMTALFTPPSATLLTQWVPGCGTFLLPTQPGDGAARSLPGAGLLT